MFDYIVFAEKLYLARKNAGLKQSDVCNKLGISQGTYSRIENGKYRVPIEMVFDFAELFSVSVNYFLEEDSLISLEDQLKIDDYRNMLIEINKNKS